MHVMFVATFHPLTVVGCVAVHGGCRSSPTVVDCVTADGRGAREEGRHGGGGREPLRRESASGRDRDDRRYEERLRGEEPRGFGGRCVNSLL